MKLDSDVLENEVDDDDEELMWYRELFSIANRFTKHSRSRFRSSGVFLKLAFSIAKRSKQFFDQFFMNLHWRWILLNDTTNDLVEFRFEFSREIAVSARMCCRNTFSCSKSARNVQFHNSRIPQAITVVGRIISHRNNKTDSFYLFLV